MTAPSLRRGVVVIALSLLCGRSIVAMAADGLHVVGLEIVGGNRTDHDWLKDYLNITLPAELTEREALNFKRKLLTTEVFTAVEVSFVPVRSSSRDQVLRIELTEKWTTIPVIRGAYGGGTPLKVAGIYNTNALGRLYTLGAEMRQYGPSPPGGVVFAKAPRWRGGRDSLGVELWRDFRRRTVYDDEDLPLGSINTSAVMARAQMLMAVSGLIPSVPGGDGHTRLQGGLDLRLRRESSVVFDRSDEAPPEYRPSDIRLPDSATDQYTALGVLLYDNIFVDNLDMDGIRFIFRSGPSVTRGLGLTRTEGEAFFYRLWTDHLNLALHGFVGQTSNDSVDTQFFLGGFDSIRGIPDGALYGTRAVYGNAEFRKIVAQWRYLWVQQVLFADGGGAGQNWGEVDQSRRASAGFGVRLAIPQVYRMVFRIDYAWSLDRPGTRGISAGLNQFFQPYAPL